MAVAAQIFIKSIRCVQCEGIRGLRDLDAYRDTPHMHIEKCML